MVRILSWLKRWRQIASPQTRMTSEQAIAVACTHLSIDANQFRLGAAPILDRGRVLWRVVTHVGLRGGHSQVLIDDASGEVIKTYHVEL
jgi:hypothetical protein